MSGEYRKAIKEKYKHSVEFAWGRDDTLSPQDKAIFNDMQDAFLSRKVKRFDFCGQEVNGRISKFNKTYSGAGVRVDLEIEIIEEEEDGKG